MADTTTHLTNARSPSDPTATSVSGVTRGVSVGRCVLSVLTVSLLVSCGDAGGSTPSADSVPAGTAASEEVTADPALAAFVEFPRYLQLKRTVEVAVTNTGDEPVRVRSVDLDSSALTDTAAIAVDSTIGPGRRRDLQVPLGDPVCDAVDTRTPTADVHLVVDGAPVDLVVDPAPLLTIVDDECGRARVFESADIGFGGHWSVDDGVLTVPIDVRMLGNDPVTLEQVAGSVIFVVEAADPVPGTIDRVEVTVDAESPAADVPVRVRAERCEPHAVAESKKTFVFPIWVAVADDDMRYVTIEPDPPLREALQTLIDECQRALASVPK